MGNSCWRLQTVLNYVAQSVQEMSREGDVEVLVTDWGSEIPLNTVLQLSPAAKKLVSFLIVPPAIAQEHQGDSLFSEVIGYNAAALRMNGLYVGRVDQDTLVGKRFIKTFFDLYEGKRQMDVPLETALMLSNRHQIPYRFASRCPSFWEVDCFIHWFGRFLGGEMYHLPPNQFIRSMVGIWLVHRDVWYACGGYDERMKYYYWMEVDMILRLMQEAYTVVDLGKVVDYDFYHLEHKSPLPHRNAYENRKSNPKIDLENPPVLQFHPNGLDWGLAQYSLEIVKCSLPNFEIETASFASRWFKWPAFAILILSSGFLIVFDRLWIPVSGYMSHWKHRITAVWKLIHGNPLTTWPGLLLDLWHKRRSHRAKH